MKNILITMLVVLAMSASAKKLVFVMIQTPSNAGYDQYYEGRFGMKTFLDKDETLWNPEPNYYYHKDTQTYIVLLPTADEYWAEESHGFMLEVAKHLEYEGYDSILHVYVGHNAMLEADTIYEYTDCSDNMLFGCFTENWRLDNTYVDTHRMIAPEAYSVIPSIKAWMHCMTERFIRDQAATGYANYQKDCSYEEALVIFGL